MQAIDQMPRPNNVTELRSFWGMINYYGRFIQNLSAILIPLNTLLQKNVPFKWSRNWRNGMSFSKKQFKSNTVLIHFDPKLPLILATDANLTAVLSHRYPDGTERVLQYASQTLTNM